MKQAPNIERRTSNSESSRMRPIEVAKAICRERGINFEQKLIEHIGSEYGVVVTRPDLFAMARVVELPNINQSGKQRKSGYAAHAAGQESRRVFSGTEGSFVPDSLAWHIEMAVGQLGRLIALFPFQLPFISFTRWKGSEHLRVYPTQKFLRKAGKQESKS